MLILNIPRKIFRILQSKISPSEIAAGFVVGMFIGLTPFFTLINIFMILCVFLFNINGVACGVSVVFFSFLGIWTDILADKIGYYLLVKVDALTPFWTFLYNLPIIPFTRFNNTVVMGNLIFSILLSIPLYYIIKKLVVIYRQKIYPKIENSKLYKIYKKANIFNFFLNIYGKIKQ